MIICIVIIIIIWVWDETIFEEPGIENKVQKEFLNLKMWLDSLCSGLRCVCWDQESSCVSTRK